MNYICYVVDVKIIRKKEKDLFDYYLSALAQCKDMKRYLFDLYQYSIHNNKPFLFTYFLDLSIKQGILPKAMKDKNFFKYIMLSESAASIAKSIQEKNVWLCRIPSFTTGSL